MGRSRGDCVAGLWPALFALAGFAVVGLLAGLTVPSALVQPSQPA